MTLLINNKRIAQATNQELTRLAEPADTSLLHHLSLLISATSDPFLRKTQNLMHIPPLLNNLVEKGAEKVTKPLMADNDSIQVFPTDRDANDAEIPLISGILNSLPVSVVVLKNINNRHKVVVSAGKLSPFHTSDNLSVEVWLDELHHYPLFSFIQNQLRLPKNQFNHVAYTSLPSGFVRLVFWHNPLAEPYPYILIWGVDMLSFISRFDGLHNIPWSVFQGFFEHCPDIMIMTDAENRISDLNAAACKLFDCGKEAIGKPLTIAKPPDSIAENHNTLIRLGKATGTAPAYTIRLQLKDDSSYTAQAVSWPVFGSNEELLGYGYWIGAERHYQSAPPSRSSLETILNTTGLLVAQIDTAGTIRYANQAFQAFFYSNNTPPPSIWILLDKKISEVIRKRLNKKTPAEKLMHFEMKTFRADGSPRWLRLQVDFYLGEDLLPTGWQLTCTDFTIDKQAGSVIVEEKLLDQRKLHQAVVKAIDNERQHFGNELHDNINNLLLITRIKLELVMKKPSADPKELKDVLDALNTTMQEVRRLSHSLAPRPRLASGLRTALVGLCSEICLKNGKHPELSYQVHHHAELTPETEITLFRIIQEALSNAVKHSQATCLEILITQLPSFLMVQLIDNGKGFDPEKVSCGHGLFSMKQRAKSLESNLYISSSPQMGTRLSVAIPSHIAYGKTPNCKNNNTENTLSNCNKNDQTTR